MYLVIRKYWVKWNKVLPFPANTVAHLQTQEDWVSADDLSLRFQRWGFPLLFPSLMNEACRPSGRCQVFCDPGFGISTRGRVPGQLPDPVLLLSNQNKFYFFYYR